MTEERYNMNEVYIPVNDESENKINALLQKQRIFGSVDQFIHLYNEGIINVNKEEVKEIAREIESSYQNIILQRNKLYVKSAEETYVERSMLFLSAWSTVAALKRIANEIVNDNDDFNTKLILLEDNPGYIYLEPELENSWDPVDVKALERYDAAERLTTSKTAIPSNIILSGMIKDYDKVDGAGYIEAEDLINLDDSFIKDIHETIKIAFG